MAKKSLKRIFAGLLAFAMVCVLAACSTQLNGTYTSTDGLINQSFTFEKDNKVKVSAFGFNIEGEYEIKGDEITITYGALGLSYDFVKSFKKEGKSIFVDGVEFVKEK